MSYLTDSTYFDGELILPAQNRAANADGLTAAIARYEPEFLRKVLGAAFANLFNAGWQAVSPDARWTALKAGATYTYSNGTQSKQWIGFQNAGKLSPIACYIYYWYRRKRENPITPAGNTNPKTENSTRVSAAPDLQLAWNRMAEWIEDLHHYLQNARTSNDLLFPEFTLSDVDEEFHPYHRRGTGKMNPFGI